MLTVANAMLTSVKAASVIETGRVGTWDCIFSSINYFSRIGHLEDAFLGTVLWFSFLKNTSRFTSS